MSKSQRVAIVVDDMFFAAKIRAAADVAGRQLQRIKSREQLGELAADPPELVIVDLNSDRISPIEAIRFLKESPALAPTPVVGFVSHVQTDLIREAQTAGCDFVLPRSAFTQMLAEIVAGNLEHIRQRTQS